MCKIWEELPGEGEGKEKTGESLYFSTLNELSSAHLEQVKCS